MMKKQRLRNFRISTGLLTGILSLAWSTSAFADESEGWWIGGSVAVTSDYVLRGVSQTDEGPAIQGSIDFGHAIGFYAGIWASNVDFDQPDGINKEVDFYTGWVFPFDNGMELDLALVRYTYPGSKSGFDIDYNEFISSLSFAEFYNATLVYTNDYLNTGERAVLYQFVAEAQFGNSPFHFRIGAGYNDISQATGSEYWDYHLGVNRDWGMVNVDLSYFGTSGYDQDIQNFLGPKKWADGRVVLTVGMEF
jgi:uncharacterized protein (TIGR02001 family)